MRADVDHGAAEWAGVRGGVLSQGSAQPQWKRWPHGRCVRTPPTANLSRHTAHSACSASHRSRLHLQPPHQPLFSRTDKTAMQWSAGVQGCRPASHVRLHYAMSPVKPEVAAVNKGASRSLASHKKAFA